MEKSGRVAEKKLRISGEKCTFIFANGTEIKRRKLKYTHRLTHRETERKAETETGKWKRSGTEKTMKEKNKRKWNKSFLKKEEK